MHPHLARTLTPSRKPRTTRSVPVGPAGPRWPGGDDLRHRPAASPETFSWSRPIPSQVPREGPASDIQWSVRTRFPTAPAGQEPAGGQPAPERVHARESAVRPTPTGRHRPAVAAGKNLASACHPISTRRGVSHADTPVMKSPLNRCQSRDQSRGPNACELDRPLECAPQAPRAFVSGVTNASGRLSGASPRPIAAPGADRAILTIVRAHLDAIPLS